MASSVEIWRDFVIKVESNPIVHLSRRFATPRNKNGRGHYGDMPHALADALIGMLTFGVIQKYQPHNVVARFTHERAIL